MQGHHTAESNLAAFHHGKGTRDVDGQTTASEERKDLSEIGATYF